MRVALAGAILLVLCMSMAYAQPEPQPQPQADPETPAAQPETPAPPPVPGLPKTLEEFQARIAEKATDPKAAVKLWFDAVFVYMLRDKALGQKMILEMDRYKEWDSKTFRLFRDQITRQPYIMFSYPKGATPENKYTFDPDKYELTYHGEPNFSPYADTEEGKFVKLFVKSNGADAPRPITMQRNAKGEYKFYEFSSIFVGVRPPVMPKIYGESVPQSVDPVWVARQWIQGILMYHAGQKEEGLAQMNSVMKEPTNDRFQSFPGMAMAKDKTHIWRSYVKGTSPENQYKVDDVSAIEIETYYQDGEAPTETSTSLRMFVRSSGADTARPLSMEKDDRGEWRVSEFSSLCVGVRPPKDPNADNF